jgi:hypothetical protein
MRLGTVVWLCCGTILGCSNEEVVGSREESPATGGQGMRPPSSTGGAQPTGTGGRTGGTSSMPTAPLPEPPPACEPSGDSESACSDGEDDDCDGFVDCRDSECDGQSCGTGDGFVCTAGACLKPEESGLPELPPIDNVRLTVRRDTAIIDFEPVRGARDYRIYPMPAPEDVLVGENGELTVQNAIYRCGGDRPMVSRDKMEYSSFDRSLEGMVADFARKEEESLLGHVYTTPGTGRTPVYRIADPDAGSGYLNADWNVSPFAEGNAANYVAGKAERDRLVAEGYRDDGIAFYVSDDGTRPVYRYRTPQDPGGYPVGRTFYFTDGREYDARDKDHIEERFSILAEPAEGSVPLRRVYYGGYAGEEYDVLAAGEPRFERALYQGNHPVWSLVWPGITEKTTFVIEALDEGCPFPNGYIASVHREPDLYMGEAFNLPSITLDEARLESGEVFINGQHDPENRPKPLARAYVDVTPEAGDEFDWFEGFDPGSEWGKFEDLRDNNARIFRNADWAIDTSGCTDNFTFGPLLGQFAMGFADGGSSCNISITPRKLATSIRGDSFLHVRMSSDIPSTLRRYPQIMLTTAKVIEPDDMHTIYEIPIHTRLGKLDYELAGPDMMEGTADDLPPVGEKSIVVQPFNPNHELQIEFCDTRGWGVNLQCPQANVYGHHANNYEEEWDMPWTPVPVMGEVAGFDRPVQFDVYASTSKVYVFVDEKPAGCAVLPEGRMPEGDITVAFRAVIYHSGIDEGVVPENSPHQFLRRYSLSHSDRKMDDFGIELEAAEPAWDESVLPCGTRWYGG